MFRLKCPRCGSEMVEFYVPIATTDKEDRLHYKCNQCGVTFSKPHIPGVPINWVQTP